MEKLNITILDLTLALAEAFDKIDKRVNNHHFDVAYLSYEIAKELDIKAKKLSTIVIAALLHEFGCFKLDERINLLNFEPKHPEEHVLKAYCLLKTYRPFSKIATLIKYHQRDWDKISTQNELTMFSNIIFLADRVLVLLEKEKNIDDQIEMISKKINGLKNKKFDSNIVEAFNKIKENKEILSNLQQEDKSLLLKKNLADYYKILKPAEIIEIGKVFAQIIDSRSIFTSVHSTTVAEIAEKLGELYGLGENEQQKLKVSGYFHDLGKLAIPDKILNKISKLTTEEFEIIKTHPYHTFEIMNKIDDFKEIAEISSKHHEKLNGTGYPFKLSEEDLNIKVRILAVSDVFAALIEPKPYRKRLKKDEIINILDGMIKDRHLDEEIVEILKQNYQLLENINLKIQDNYLEKFKQLDIILNSKISLNQNIFYD